MDQFLEKIDFANELRFKIFKEMGINTIGPHCHPEVEFIYSKKGSVKVGIGNDLINLEENEIVYFPPGQLHYFLSSPENERYVFLFDLECLNASSFNKELNTTLFNFLEQGELYSKYWPDALCEEIKNSLEKMYENLGGRSKKYNTSENFFLLGMTSLIISSLIEYLPKKHVVEGSNVKNARRYRDSLEQLNRVILFVQDNYSDPIRLKDVANYIGFNQYYFTKFFKKLTGKTFMTFVEDYRIQQAKYILCSEEIPISEVADRSGFESIKTFHHVFKKKVGYSPLQYQKKMMSSEENVM